MIQARESTDAALLRAVLSLPVETWRALQKTGCRFWLVEKDNKPAGGFVLRPTRYGWELHTELSLTGKDALLAGRLALSDMRQKLGQTPILSFCPDNNPKTLVFAKAMNCKTLGRKLNATFVQCP